MKNQKRGNSSDTIYTNPLKNLPNKTHPNLLPHTRVRTAIQSRLSEELQGQPSRIYLSDPNPLRTFPLDLIWSKSGLGERLIEVGPAGMALQLLQKVLTIQEQTHPNLHPHSADNRRFAYSSRAVQILVGLEHADQGKANHPDTNLYMQFLSW